MKKYIKSEKPLYNLTNEEWKKIILDDELLNDCSYLGYCVNETLRIDPSVRFSTVHEIAGACTIGKYKILDGQEFMINFIGLHTNPEQWRSPEKFIPERFNPSSPFFLTPEGKRRHPMSYGPFLGGKRVCLGKTFAENIGKSILAIIFG